MAIINSRFLCYLTSIFEKTLKTNSPAYLFDPLVVLIEHCLEGNKFDKISSLDSIVYNETKISKTKEAFGKKGLAGILLLEFQNGITNNSIDVKTERRVLALKKGFPNLPATKASIIMNGFKCNSTSDDILSIYASHGFAIGQKKFEEKYDFNDINRRVYHLSWIINQPFESDAGKILQKRYLAMRSYLTSVERKKEEAIQKSGLTRSLFFYYWKSFARYGLLGLVDRGKEIFRESKMGLANEARIIIDKLQYPERNTTYYVRQLSTKGIKIDRTSISKIFSKWNISTYKTEFISNLKRLEIDSSFSDQKQIKLKKKVNAYYRLVDSNFILLLEGIKKNGLYVDAPGLFIIWTYLEELKIFNILSEMGLTYSKNGKGYNWLDHLLLNIARIFYGISSYSRTCGQEEPSLSLFCHLVSLPCNDSFLNGLGSISEKQVFKLQQWLIQRSKELGIIKGERVAFDFKNIDLNVDMGNLRGFGKGPSPQKKICCHSFRPHIVWDLDTGNIIALEFRKGSARGTTTVKRFSKDFILKPFKGVFKEVYIDSEYTGKDVWNFILDSKEGMGADITACLKQNSFVRKERDKFLFKHNNEEGFWIHYDDQHVYTKKTFLLTWKFSQKGVEKELQLNCVIKKNIKNGSLRCFGSSKKNFSSKQILEDYSYRWSIEIGIKDLNQSYYLTNCPGKNPHHVNVHFFIVSICRHLFRMIQRDIGDLIKRKDGSIKTLQTMREILFRQGSAKVYLKEDTFEVNFLNSYSPQLTTQLEEYYDMISARHSNGMELIGGLKMKYNLKTPLGKEHKNSMKKMPLISGKNNSGSAKNA
jgi:hypothetical protein